MLSSIQNLRNALQAQNRCMSLENCFATIIIIDYDTPWEIPPIRNITSVLKSQLNIDPEKNIHSPDLYAVWNAKTWMLQHVAAQNPFQTKYFLWVDAGAFRSKNYRFGSWPKNERARDIFERNGQDKLLLGLMRRFSDVMCAKLRNISTPYSVQDGPLRRDLIQGTMFGGSRESIRWWSDLYYKTVGLYISKNWFVGKDQDTMNSLVLAYPDRINVFLTFKVNCGDPWFAFGPLFSDQSLVRKIFGDKCQLENLSSIVVSPRESCLY